MFSKFRVNFQKNDIFIGKLLKIWGQLSKNLSTTMTLPIKSIS